MSQPVVIVTAPAGYGKTVAARSVWARFDGAKAWWTVTPNDQLLEHGVPRLIAAASAAWGVPSSNAGNGFPDFLAALASAQGGLLLIDDTQTVAPALWGAIAQMIAMAPHRCRTLLFCRFAPPLPLMLWQSQGRLQQFDQSLLELTPEEWARAGFQGGEAACREACGWWSAEIAAQSRPSAGPWNPALASWISDAWFAHLPDRHQYLFGLASLLPELSADDFGAVAAQSKTMADASLAELAALPGPVELTQNRVRLSPRYRLYIAQAWRHNYPDDWAQAARNGVQILLTRGEATRAAELSHESGLPELQVKVLERAGWTLLFSRHRVLLEPLLDGIDILPEVPPAAQLLQYAWQVEVNKTPHKAEPKLRTLMARLDGAIKGQALAISATMGWNYDDLERSVDEAEAALASFEDDDHPAYHYALLALANGLAGLGRLQEAEQHMRRVLAYAKRDDLIYLQLEAMHRRAHLACDAGRFDEALELATHARRLAQQADLPRASVLDSTGRLMSWIHMLRLELPESHAALSSGAPAAEAFGEYWSFPYRLHRAWLALADDRLSQAEDDIHWLTQRLSEQFYCLKWKNEASLAQLWLAARRGDRARLSALADELAACDWPPSLHRDRRRVLLAAAWLLLGQNDAGAELAELEARLQAQGAKTLALQLQLIRALSCSPFDRDLLLRHVRAAATQRLAFDYVWLASRAIAPLEQLLGAPELIHETEVLGFVRRTVQRLLQPAAALGGASADESAPPDGLTEKEWQILQLIGQQYTNEQIAAKLFVSLATVKTHINHIYSKLDLRSRIEAVRRARELTSSRAA